MMKSLIAASLLFSTVSSFAYDITAICEGTIAKNKIFLHASRSVEGKFMIFFGKEVHIEQYLQYIINGKTEREEVNGVTRLIYRGTEFLPIGPCPIDLGRIANFSYEEQSAPGEGEGILTTATESIKLSCQFPSVPSSEE